jgi:Tfp pilus assembly protein PilX
MAEHLHTRRSPIANERGATLITALLLLAVLSVLGTTAYLTSSVEVKIAGNYKTSKIAFYAAEAGVEEAMNRLNLDDGDTNFIGEAVGAAPTAGWGRYIVRQAGGSDGAYTELVTMQTVDGTEMDYQVKIYYKIEDSTYNNGADNDEMVLYGTDFGYGGDAPTTGTFPVIVMESTGSGGNNSSSTVTVEVSRFPLDIGADAALASDDAVTVGGSSLISGFNHDISTSSGDSAGSSTGLDGNDLGFDNNGAVNYSGTGGIGNDTAAGPEDSVPYGSKIESSGHKTGIWTTGDTAQSQGSNESWGGNNVDAWKDESAAPSAWKTLAQLLGISDNALQAILNNADVTVSDTTGGNNHLDAAPQGIVYIDGDLSISNSTPSNDDGWGLMYVTGDLSITQLDYKGLIYVEGEMKVTGHFWLLGSMAVANSSGAGPSGAGNGTILYSTEALEQKVGQSMKHYVLSYTNQ